MEGVTAIILAAGEGKRMRSRRPKVLHPLCGRPLIDYALRAARQRGRVTRIVEERDATDDQKRITEINTSVYCFDARRLWPALSEVRSDNDQGEYYLTDVIGILARAGGRIEAITVHDPAEA